MIIYLDWLLSYMSFKQSGLFEKKITFRVTSTELCVVFFLSFFVYFCMMIKNKNKQKTHNNPSLRLISSFFCVIICLFVFRGRIEV